MFRRTNYIDPLAFIDNNKHEDVSLGRSVRRNYILWLCVQCQTTMSDQLSVYSEDVCFGCIVSIMMKSPRFHEKKSIVDTVGIIFNLHKSYTFAHYKFTVRTNSCGEDNDFGFSRHYYIEQSGQPGICT